MSLFQTLVLLMFNEGEEFSLEEIKLATGIGLCYFNKTGLVANWFFYFYLLQVENLFVVTWIIFV